MYSPKKKRIKLSEQTSPISFKLQYDTLNGRYKVTFNDTNAIQIFIDFEDYLYELSLYYRNRMNAEDLIERKLELCEEFINTLYLYSTDHRKYSKDKIKFESVINVFVNQFEYFKKAFNENRKLSLLEKPIENETLSLKESLIILDYLGILQIMIKPSPSREAAFKLIGKVLNQNAENVKKGINNINKVEKKGAIPTKTIKTLNTVLELAKNIGYKDIEQQAQADLEKIK